MIVHVYEWWDQFWREQCKLCHFCKHLTRLRVVEWNINNENTPLLDSSDYFDNLVRFCLSSVRLGGGWLRIPEIEFRRKPASNSTKDRPSQIRRKPKNTVRNVRRHIYEYARCLCANYIYFLLYIHIYIYAAMCYRSWVHSTPRMMT